MYVQILTYQLRDIADEDWQVESEAFAPAFAAVPGLVGTLWFADPEVRTYGGVLLWESGQAMGGFFHSPAFRSIAVHPCVTDVAVQEFDVWDYHSRLTGGAEMLPPVARNRGREPVALFG